MKHVSTPIELKAGINSVTFGQGVKYIAPCNLYECNIGDYCFIGPFVEIQKGVTVGKNCKIQSHSFICELVSVGHDVFIGHGVMFINDTFQNNGPAGGRKELWTSTKVGNHVSIGSNATILPVNICDHTVIGAGAVITKDITEPGVYCGNPAKKIKDIATP